MPAILYPLREIVKNFNTIEYSGGTGYGFFDLEPGLRIIGKGAAVVDDQGHDQIH